MKKSSWWLTIAVATGLVAVVVMCFGNWFAALLFYVGSGIALNVCYREARYESRE